ncbi:unnamed protein product, partial [marine sediment metagenome]
QRRSFLALLSAAGDVRRYAKKSKIYLFLPRQN